MDLSITFNNISSATFQLSVSGYNLAVVDNTSQLPAATMGPMDTQVMSITNQTPVGEGAAWFWCCWFDPVTNVRFGVKILDGGQPFGMGPRPTWQAMADDQPIDAPPVWGRLGQDPAAPYTWDASVGFAINGTPTSTHETLNIVVLIQNLPQTEPT